MFYSLRAAEGDGSFDLRVTRYNGWLDWIISFSKT